VKVLIAIFDFFYPYGRDKGIEWTDLREREREREREGEREREFQVARKLLEVPLPKESKSPTMARDRYLYICIKNTSPIKRHTTQHHNNTAAYRVTPQQHRSISQHNTTQHTTTTPQHIVSQHNTIQHNTTQYNTTQHNTTQHNTTHTTQHNTYILNQSRLGSGEIEDDRFLREQTFAFDRGLCELLRG
jgi:hypothetical protein